MDLTVVIASIDSARSIDRCLRHLEHSCAGLKTEFIVADASHDDTASILEASGGSAILVRCPPGTLTPVLWAQGLGRSTGRVVAFTTGHCLVTPGWAPALMQAIDNGASGAGGPLIIGDSTTPLDWAIFYLRYARFMPHTLGTGRLAGEIAGDNAAYAREALDRHAGTFSQGFWEVDFHRLIRADGGWLAGVPGAVVEYSRSFRASTILHHRYAHGQQFGSGRVTGGSRKAWQVLLAAPLVPLVLAVRAAPHAARAPHPWRFLLALPWFVLLAGAWAAGEAVGAWRPPSGQTA